ncbi:superoxide dismutase [Holosporaceae bacterium 'Namur']|nr:superoxide dismutase [Holosporaceae bacterium 'Namur']
MLKDLLAQRNNFTLPQLPYAKNALEPYVSEETLSFHHGKHHQTYVTNLNNLIKDTPFAEMGLEDIIKESYKKADKVGIFNNAAQVWNHAFLWHCMKKDGGGLPSQTLQDKINKDFGSMEKFTEEFKNAAITQFGSGWAWLISDKDKLKVIKTANAELPMVLGQKALLTIDVWEHAYYLDYHNRRADYVNTFIEKLINWQFVEENFNSR